MIIWQSDQKRTALCGAARSQCARKETQLGAGGVAQMFLSGRTLQKKGGKEENK